MMPHKILLSLFIILANTSYAATPDWQIVGQGDVESIGLIDINNLDFDQRTGYILVRSAIVTINTKVNYDLTMFSTAYDCKNKKSKDVQVTTYKTGNIIDKIDASKISSWHNIDSQSTIYNFVCKNKSRKQSFYKGGNINELTTKATSRIKTSQNLYMQSSLATNKLNYYKKILLKNENFRQLDLLEGKLLELILANKPIPSDLNARISNLENTLKNNQQYKELYATYSEALDHSNKAFDQLMKFDLGSPLNEFKED